MTYEEINRKLNQIRIEDFIWAIYIGIIFLSWYSNGLERNYFIYNDKISKEKYRKIMILIFAILIVVYLYFVKDAYEGIKNLKPSDTERKKNLAYLSFLGSLLIAMSGFIFIYIAITNEELNVEIAFT